MFLRPSRGQVCPPIIPVDDCRDGQKAVSVLAAGEMGPPGLGTGRMSICSLPAHEGHDASSANLQQRRQGDHQSWRHQEVRCGSITFRRMKKVILSHQHPNWRAAWTSIGQVSLCSLPAHEGHEGHDASSTNLQQRKQGDPQPWGHREVRRCSITIGQMQDSDASSPVSVLAAWEAGGLDFNRSTIILQPSCA